MMRRETNNFICYVSHYWDKYKATYLRFFKREVLTLAKRTPEFIFILN